jgi:hypothetical protein
MVHGTVAWFGQKIFLCIIMSINMSIVLAMVVCLLLSLSSEGRIYRSHLHLLPLLFPLLSPRSSDFYSLLSPHHFKSMSNSYGFDFLRAEHNLPTQGSVPSTPVPVKPQPSNIGGASSSNNKNKSLLEKQADILLFLRHHRSSGCLPPSIIQKSLGINLSSDPVAELLQKNPKIIVEEVPDPENPSLSILYYGYRAKFSSVKDRGTLIAQINRSRYGVRWSDLLDAYDGVEKVRVHSHYNCWCA